MVEGRLDFARVYHAGHRMRQCQFEAFKDRIREV